MRSFKDVEFKHLDLDVIIDFILQKCDAEVKMLLAMTDENFKKIEISQETSENMLVLINKFSHFKDIVEYHIRKEELILFPYLRRYTGTQAKIQKKGNSSSAKLSNPVEIIKTDHQKILVHLDSLKTYYVDFIESNDHLIRLCIAGLTELDGRIKENVSFHHAVLFPKILSLQNVNNRLIN